MEAQRAGWTDASEPCHGHRLEIGAYGHRPLASGSRLWSLKRGTINHFAQTALQCPEHERLALIGNPVVAVKTVEHFR